MNKDKLRWFLTGVVVAVTLLALSATAFAAVTNRQITASYSDIKIYVDGALISPTDASGNVVEPFIYNGTTYLPVRAVGEALGKTVEWDGTTNSIYLGARPTNTSVPEPSISSTPASSTGTAVIPLTSSSYLPNFLSGERNICRLNTNYSTQWFTF